MWKKYDTKYEYAFKACHAMGLKKWSGDGSETNANKTSEDNLVSRDLAEVEGQISFDLLWGQRRF